jgi:hypothetical protein
MPWGADVPTKGSLNDAQTALKSAKVVQNARGAPHPGNRATVNIKVYLKKVYEAAKEDLSWGAPHAESFS